MSYNYFIIKSMARGANRAEGRIWMAAEERAIPKNEYLAHVAESRSQTVTEHLEGTAALCARFAGAFGDEEQGRLLGLAHDIGKCSAPFQKRLRGGPKVDHASAGALECARLGADWAAACVAGHHGGLPDVGNPKTDAADTPTLCGRIKKAASGGIPAYEAPLPLPQTGNPPGYGEDPLTDSFIIRMLYSCLVDADYLDTERFMSNGATERGGGETLPALLDKLERHISPWWNPDSDLNQRRCEILRACLEGGEREKGLYTLTVPTGGGKTVSSMAFALRHAVKHGMDRVIYVIPYTSIIEQTADVFREIFGNGNVVEHHSNALYEVDESGDPEQYRLAAATENWDAPIIVTTAVRFFESLYANRPSKCRKLHNIANSVVVFDEAQMFPTGHLRPCVAAISALVARFGVTAVLCTATQPVLNDLFARYAPGNPITELCPDVPSMFERLRRVTFDRAGTLDADSLAERLAAHPRVLCVVNSRKAARDIYEKLPPEGSFHLSTLLYPVHRRAVLAEIRRRLLEGLPCRVVSTSLIEAGVDVNFPAVYREMAGLDSILQAAGRCNREGKESPEDSVVTIFDGLSVTPPLQRVNIGAAEEALKGGADPADPETVKRYFQIYRSLAGENLDKAKVVSAFEDWASTGCVLPFRSAAEGFHFIDNAAKTVYIPEGDGAALARRLRGGERSRDLFRRLGQYGVSVYERHFQALLRHGGLEPLDDGSAVLREEALPELYDENKGLALDFEDMGFLNI